MPICISSSSIDANLAWKQLGHDCAGPRPLADLGHRCSQVQTCCASGLIVCAEYLVLSTLSAEYSNYDAGMLAESLIRPTWRDLLRSWRTR